MIDKKKKIFVIYAKSGGGHQSVADAIGQSISKMAPYHDVEILDGFQDLAILSSKWTNTYKYSINHARRLYNSVYDLTDGFLQNKTIEGVFGLLLGFVINKFIDRNNADLYISCHPFFNMILPRPVQKKTHARFVSVITDPITPHAHNFSQYVDLCVVSSNAARDIAIKQKLNPKQIRVIGHPVQREYIETKSDRKYILKSLGLTEDKITVLITGGADGLGKVYDTVIPLCNSGLPIQMIVVCGRNEKLYSEINKKLNKSSVLVFEYLNGLADMMSVSDIVVAKPGASTIHESFVYGLPVIMYDAIIGQESGNVKYIENNGAGKYCLNVNQVVQTVGALVKNPMLKENMSTASKRLSDKNAAFRVANECLSLLN